MRAPLIAERVLRDQRRSLVAWIIGVVALIAMYSAFFPSIKGNAAQLDRFFNSLPEALRNAIGTASYSTPTGYLQSEVFSIMAPLLLLIHAIGAGARGIAGEEGAGTLDLLLANPVTRGRVVAEKFLAMVLSTTLLGVVVWAACAIVGPPFGLHVALASIAWAAIASTLLAVAFGSVALAVGAWRGRRGAAVGITAAAAVATYLMDVLAPSAERVAWLERLSPFHYSVGTDPLNGGMGAVDVTVMLAIAAVAVAVALMTFERRDLSG